MQSGVGCVCCVVQAGYAAVPVMATALAAASGVHMIQASPGMGPGNGQPGDPGQPTAYLQAAGPGGPGAPAG